MGAALYEKLDQATTLVQEILSSGQVLPLDVTLPLEHALDDLQQARGRERSHPPGYGKVYLGRFTPGDVVGFLLNSYPGPSGLDVTPPVPDVRIARIIEPPRHRSPNDREDMGNKQWFFTSDLPASVTAVLDCTMHVETSSDYREVFHLRTDHWSRWREKNGDYWSILTIIPES